MIFLIFLYLSLGSSFALPNPSILPTDIPPSSLFSRNDDVFGTRSIWGIIWSCFSTLFACTWIAVHPNIPGPKESRWAILRRRVAIMGYVLIAPEMVIWWAARQHSGARRIAKKYQGRGWTMAHGFFLVMGGFTLHDERGAALRTLLPPELEELSNTGKITWPSITEEEIQDRSKGDYLSKSLVLVQTGWFITQCIVRGAYGLAVTELEMATLAFAAVTGVTYYLWWDKPLDVRCSVPVYRSNQGHSGSPSSMSEENHTHPPVAAPNYTLDVQEPNSTISLGPNSTRMQRYCAFIQRHCNGFIYAFLFHPILTFFGALADMAESNTLHHSSPLRVHTFYAPDDGGRFSVSVGTSIAVIFGGIHCIAWSFNFPSLQERLAWRISAVFVFGFPISFISLVWFNKAFKRHIEGIPVLGKIYGAVMPLIFFTLPGTYIVARITLLILACIALRALPPAAYVEIQWTSFIPHIG